MASVNIFYGGGGDYRILVLHLSSSICFQSDLIATGIYIELELWNERHLDVEWQLDSEELCLYQKNFVYIESFFVNSKLQSFHKKKTLNYDFFFQNRLYPAYLCIIIIIPYISNWKFNFLLHHLLCYKQIEYISANIYTVLITKKTINK